MESNHKILNLWKNGCGMYVFGIVMSMVGLQF